MNDTCINRSETTGGDPDCLAGGALPARTLERLIGKPAASWAIHDLVDLYRERRIRLISLMHVGGDGWLKTLDFVPRDAEHLRDILEGESAPTDPVCLPGKEYARRPPTCCFGLESKALFWTRFPAARPSF